MAPKTMPGLNPLVVSGRFENKVIKVLELANDYLENAGSDSSEIDVFVGIKRVQKQQ